MTFHRSLWLCISTFLLPLIPFPARAEVSSRECIGLASYPPDQAYVIPMGQTVTLLNLDFNVYSDSNAVFAAQIYYHDSSQQVAQRMRYDIQLDGSDAGRLTTPIQYYHRTPAITQGTNSIRAFYTHVTAGTHTASLSIINNNPRDILIAGAFLNSLFVDAGELNASDLSTSTQSVGATFTTVGQLTVPNVSGRHLFISSYIRASAAGTATFRYLVNGTEVERQTTNYRNTDDGALLDYIIQGAVPGQLVELQASGPVTVTVVEMGAQALQQYTVLGATSDSTGSVPSNFAEQQITLTPAMYLSPQSLSGPPSLDGTNFGTCVWGTSDVLTSMTTSGEVETFLHFFQDGNDLYPGGDMGVVGNSPDATGATYHQQSDVGCGGGLFPYPHYYQIQQSLRGLCTMKPARQIAYGHRRIQYLVLPAPCPNPPSQCGPWIQGGALDNHTCTHSGCDQLCTVPATVQQRQVSLPNWCN
jgi:hypothetical protein